MTPEPQAPAKRAGAAGAAPDTPIFEFQESGRGLGIAYAYLNRRERTVAEVRARLEKAEIDAQESDAVIAELIEYGYLDDARYARVFAQDKRTLEQWGQGRIARTLQERGIDRDLVAATLAGEDEHDEAAQALELLQRRFPDGPAEHKDRERAFGVLIRKGYDADLAADAVRAWAKTKAA